MPNKPTPITECRNLGPSSAKTLADIGIRSLTELESKGAIEVFVSLALKDNKLPNLNLLYAMLGAIDDRHWTEYRSQKGELLLIIESQLEIHRQIKFNR